MIRVEKQLATLEVMVVSAEGLTLSGRPVKKNAFVTLSTDPHNYASTLVDADGGGYPRWDERLLLALPPSARSLAVEVRCKARGRSGGVRSVGAVSVPVSDFYGGILPADYLHCLSYRLRDAHGDRNGIINLRVRVHAATQQLPPQGVPLPPSWALAGKVGGGVAVAIPVQYLSMEPRGKRWD